jgi:hypothetical protein
VAADQPRRVGIAWDSVQRRLDDYGWDELWLLFAQEGSSPRPLAEGIKAAEAAMRHATSTLADEVVGRGAEPSPFGPAVWIDHITSEEGLRVWLSAFAEHLQDAGWSGMVGAHPQAWFPEWLQELPASPRPTAYLAYTLDPPGFNPAAQAPPRWAVDSETTAALCEGTVEWAWFDGASPYLSTGSSQVLSDGQGSAQMLAWSAGFAASAGLTAVSREPFEFRQVQLREWGQVVVQVADAQFDWKGLVDRVTLPLTWHPDVLDLAFVRPRPAWVVSWLDIRVPPLPFVSEYDVLANRHLWNRFVPDVHGIQVLTDAHLSRAGNLDAWEVERVAAGRHLVQARDLAAWYAGDGPDAEVLAAARRDFADMLLTPDVIAAHRPG